MTLEEAVARRFLAGDVVPFKARPGTPMLSIGGRKYALSTDGGPLGDREEDSDREEEFGARFIAPNSNANKWRYLWAYDTDKQLVGMWRVSDGSEKVYGPARSEMSTILRLDKKGQINRVTNAEFRKLDAYMKEAEEDTVESLKRIIEESKGVLEKAIDREIQKLWLKLKPSLDRALSDVAKGAIPIGFKPFSTENIPRQTMTYAIGNWFKHNMSTESVLKVIAPKIPQLDADLAGHYQDVQWAIDDIRDQAYNTYLEYLPRPISIRW
jgi:hypothetical protein